MAMAWLMLDSPWLPVERMAEETMMIPATSSTTIANVMPKEMP